MHITRPDLHDLIQQCGFLNNECPFDAFVFPVHPPISPQQAIFTDLQVYTALNFYSNTQYLLTQQMQYENQDYIGETDMLKKLIKQQGCFFKQFDWIINLVVNDCLVEQKDFNILKQNVECLDLEKVKYDALSLSLKEKLNAKSAISSYLSNQKGMSQKKSYQILVFTKKIQQSFPKNLGVMIDIGCGQGYLCEALEKIQFASKPQIKGLDYNEELIQTAIKQSPQESTVEYICQSFDSKSKIQSKQKIDKYGFISLHGCGLLFQSIVDNFLLNEGCQYFASVSCCYNLIPTQKFRLRSEEGKVFFPTSIVVRSFVMIACQCVDTWELNKQKTENSYRNTIFRAVLQKLLIDHGIAIPDRLGKINTKNIFNFADYLRQVVKTGNVFIQMEKVDINHYEQLCKVHSALIRKIWTLKGWIGLVAESFIATDRILHLRSHPGIKSQIISLFDRNISARNICIIGEKLEKQQQYSHTMKNQQQLIL